MVVKALDDYKELLSGIDLYVYTLFCINEKDNDYDIDDEFVTSIKGKNIGLITDDYKKVLNLISH